MNRIAELLSHDGPVLVGGIDDRFDDAFPATAAHVGLDVAELRIDRFDDRSADGVVHAIARLGTLVKLATIRPVFEGGEWTASESTRLALFERVVANVDGIDIELSAHEIAAETIALAKAAGAFVIGSHHDFAATPGRQELERVVDDAIAAGVDLVKIAAMVTTKAELRALASLQLMDAPIPMVVIAMGAVGASSRVLFPLLGPGLIYCDLGMGNAPGQLPLGTALDTMRMLSPAFNARKAATR